MEDKTFLNKRVSELVELTPRQVLSWTEKGLVIAFRESRGVGRKREYSYINLLEFAICKILSDLGLGFRLISRLMRYLKGKGLIESWATNFSNYHEKCFKESKASLSEAINKIKKEGRSDTYLEELFTRLKEPFKPKKSVGSLIYYFGNEEQIFLIPWEIDHVLNLNLIRTALSGNQGFLLIDVGRIKAGIDRKL